MTSPLLSVLAATITRAAPSSQSARLESRAHGTVAMQANFTRREVVRETLDGKVPMLDGEALAFLPTHLVPKVEKGDLIHIDGALWHIRFALDESGLMKSQLTKPIPVNLRMAGRDVTVHIAGIHSDVEEGGTIVALTMSRVAPGAAQIGRDDWTVLDAGAWGDGWDRLVLRAD